MPSVGRSVQEPGIYIGFLPPSEPTDVNLRWERPVLDPLVERARTYAERPLQVPRAEESAAGVGDLAATRLGGPLLDRHTTRNDGHEPPDFPPLSFDLDPEDEHIAVFT